MHCKCTVEKSYVKHLMSTVIVTCIAYQWHGLKNESSRERKFPGHFAPMSEMAMEQMGQGAKGPGSESSRKRIGQGPSGRFNPGCEWAQEREGCESFSDTEATRDVNIEFFPNLDIRLENPVLIRISILYIAAH